MVRVLEERYRQKLFKSGIGLLDDRNWMGPSIFHGEDQFFTRNVDFLLYGHNYDYDGQRGKV